MDEIKDEYHTMKEVYAHRNLLFINLCLRVPDDCFWKMDNEKDWVILYLRTKQGQISYHVPRYYLPLFEKKIERNDNFIWDGTDSVGVLNLLARPFDLL